MTYSLPRIDTDGDDQVENANVDALVNFAASDTLSAYPLAIGTDTDHTASDHADGGSLEIDAADLAGGSGTTGNFLQTDGAALTWVDVDFTDLTGSASLAQLTAILDGTNDIEAEHLSASNLPSHASRHSDGGADELDVADLAGGLGAADNVPISDGAAVAWGTLPNAGLTNDSVTVAGNSVALGASTSVAHDDLSDDVTGAADQDNSGTTAIQDVTVDAHGHVTSMTAADVGGSGSSWSTTTITSDTTAADNDEILADSSASALTVTLPTPSNGLRVRCKRIASANGVTLSRSGTENIDGSASDYSISYLQSLEVVSDGTDWWIV